MSKPIVQVRNLGLIAYQEAWDLQEALLKVAVDLKIENRKQNTAVLAAHHLLFASIRMYIRWARAVRQKTYCSIKRISTKFKLSFSKSIGEETLLTMAQVSW